MPVVGVVEVVVCRKRQVVGVDGIQEAGVFGRVGLVRDAVLQRLQGGVVGGGVSLAVEDAPVVGDEPVDNDFDDGAGAGHDGLVGAVLQACGQASEQAGLRVARRIAQPGVVRPWGDAGIGSVAVAAVVPLVCRIV